MAGAQNPLDQPDVQDLGRFEVVASPEAVLGAEASHPILVIDAEQIRRSGQLSLGDLLQDLPIAGAALNTTFNNGGNGATEVDMRHLGAHRTLVLVNGRRWIKGAGWPGVASAVDLNTIPLSLVDRVEILRSGASSIYGSDAIAGVINVITRKGGDQLVADAHFGRFTAGDGTQRSLTFSLSRGFGESRLNAQLSYLDIDPVMAKDRGIAAVPKAGTGLTRGSVAIEQGRLILAEPGVDSEVLDLTVERGSSGQSVEDFLPFQEQPDRYNYATENFLGTPSRRWSVFLQGLIPVGETMELQAEALYGGRDSSQRLAPAPLVVSSNFNNDLVIAASNPYNPFGVDLVGPAVDLGPGSARILLFGRRLAEAGPRIFAQDVTTTRLSLGLTGDRTLWSRPVSWEASYTFSENAVRSETRGQLNIQNLRLALGPLDDCRAVPGCVPLNLFGGQGPDGSGSISNAMLDFIVFNGAEEGGVRLHAFNLLGNTAAVTLPYGDVILAAGYEHRRESAYDRPNPVRTSGAASGFNRQPTAGDIVVDELFTEASVPLLSDLSFAELLEINAAVRFSRYDTFGDTLTHKLGLVWQPLLPLMFRAHFAEGFRAPDVAELFGGVVEEFTLVTDPCSNLDRLPADNPIAVNCIRQGVPADGSYAQSTQFLFVERGPNALLEPEASDSLTIGLGWQARENLSLNLDWYRVKLRNAITPTSAQETLDRCASIGQSCELVGRSATGAITTLRSLPVNLGQINVEGWDFVVQYTPQRARWGDWDVSWATSYLKEFTRRSRPVEVNGLYQEENFAGRNTGENGYPRWKSYLDIGVTVGPWQAGWIVRYVGRQMEDCNDFLDGTPESLSSLGVCSQPGFDAEGRAILDGDGNPVPAQNELDATWYHNVQITRHWADGNLSTTMGVNNLLNQIPPVSTQAFANSFDPTLYEVPGRMIYLRVRAAF